MRKTMSLSLALIAILVLTAATVGAQTTITFYDPRPNAQIGGIIDTLLAEFAEQNPDIIVEYVHVPGSYNGVRDKTTVAFAGGAAPNIVILEQGHWFALAVNDMLLPMTQFIENDPTVSLDDYYPGMVDFLTWNDDVWGLPIINSTPLMYYNKHLFETRGLSPEAPRNWDEYLAFGRRISQDTDGDGVNDVLMIQFYNDNWFFLSWVGQNGGRVANEDGTEYIFNSPETIEALTFMQSLVQEHQIAKVGSFSSIYADFWDGKLAITEQSTAALAGNFRTAATNGIDMGVAPMACQKECYAVIGGGNMHMINTGTDAEKEAAWRLVSFLQQPENLARIGASSGYMAGRRSAMQTDTLRDFFSRQPGAIITYAQLEFSMPKPRIPNWSQFSGQLTSAVLRILDGANVQQEVDELVRRGNEMLKEWYEQN